MNAPLYPLRIEQYHDMIRTGILAEDEPVELLQGLLVAKMSKNPPHTLAARRLRKALASLLPPDLSLDTQEPITLATSEPEPDLFVYRGQESDYEDHHPGPADVLLVVEIADSSLARDRGVKQAIYAAGPIPVYWIVNLIDRQVEVYTEPEGAAYQRRHDYHNDDEVSVMLAGVTVGRVAVRALWS